MGILRKSQGTAVAVTDAEMLEDISVMGRDEGLFVAPEGEARADAGSGPHLRRALGAAVGSERANDEGQGHLEGVGGRDEAAGHYVEREVGVLRGGAEILEELAFRAADEDAAFLRRAIHGGLLLLGEQRENVAVEEMVGEFLLKIILRAELEHHAHV